MKEKENVISPDCPGSSLNITFESISPLFLHLQETYSGDCVFSLQDEANSVPVGVWSCTELLSGSGIACFKVR